jgi:hypothetical protein
MNGTCSESIDRELTEAELAHVRGGRKAGERPQEYLSSPFPQFPITTNSIRGTGGQFGP